MPFLLCSAKPTEHLFMCVMVSAPADPPPDHGKLNARYNTASHAVATSSTCICIAVSQGAACCERPNLEQTTFVSISPTRAAFPRADQLAPHSQYPLLEYNPLKLPSAKYMEYLLKCESVGTPSAPKRIYAHLTCPPALAKAIYNKWGTNILTLSM